jgi:DNA-binding PucR family transcriptional regulator
MINRTVSPPTGNDQVSSLYGRLLAHLERGDDLSALMALLAAIEALPGDMADKPLLGESAQRAVAIWQRLELHQQKERALRTVFESAQALTELGALDDVLLNIVVRGRKLLGSDLAWLAGSDANDGRFRVLAIDGASHDASKDMYAPPDAGIAGHVAKTRLPFTSSQYLADESFSHDATIDLILSREGLQSVAAVPLLAEADVIGILIVGNRYQRTYQPWEVSILTILAAHASTAIRNALAYAAKQQALREVESANRNLQEKVAALEFAADADVRLTKQLAKGAGLQEMVEVIAAILQGHIAFLDSAGKVLCTATPQVRQSFSDDAGTAEALAALPGIRTALNQSLFAGHSVPVDTGIPGYCRVVAVLSGDDHLGSLLIHKSEPLSDDEVRVFERCSTAMAVVALLADRKSLSVRQDAHLTVRALLDKSQHASKDLATRAKRHGLDIEAPAVIGVLAVERAKASYFLRKIPAIFRQYPHIATEIDGRLVVIVNRSDPSTVREELVDIVRNEVDAAYLGCVSRTVSGPAALADAHHSAKRVIALLGKLQRERCVVYEPQVAMYAAMFQPHSASDIAETIEATIGPLIAYDSRRGTRLVETLLTFLEEKQNARAAARSLGIHVNTMHKRLETINKLLGDWNEGGRTVEIHVALRLWDIQHGQQDLP